MVWDAKNMPIVFGKTRVIAIIGYPISHSLSPLMQNAAFAAGALDYIYVPFAVSSDNLERAVLGMRALGVCGFNVTIPHKSAIIPFLDQLDESAEAAGAVNTVLLSEAGLTGYNTDGDGLVDSLATELDFVPDAGQILVIGAGGAARGAIAALCRSGAKKIVIFNRSYANAQAVKIDMQKRYPETDIEVMPVAILDSVALIINTTSLGMKNERIQGVNLATLSKNAKVYDMVYSKVATPLIRDASALGLRTSNGLSMLAAQGERAFKIWTGQKPPEGVMRKALDMI